MKTTQTLGFLLSTILVSKPFLILNTFLRVSGTVLKNRKQNFTVSVQENQLSKYHKMTVIEISTKFDQKLLSTLILTWE